jgi:hypothetical protein
MSGVRSDVVRRAAEWDGWGIAGAASDRMREKGMATLAAPFSPVEGVVFGDGPW